LNAKFLRAFATPSFDSNLEPALTRTVKLAVGALLAFSTAATLTPFAASVTAVAKDLLPAAVRAADTRAAENILPRISRGI
jgi:hypothetical protein